MKAARWPVHDVAVDQVRFAFLCSKAKRHGEVARWEGGGGGEVVQ